MNFTIMAIKLFQYYVKNNQLDPNNVKVVASTSTDNKIEEVPEENKLVLNYDDNATSFNDSIANQIKSFVDGCSSSDNIYIMCDAGESRSAAISAALNRYYNGNDDSIWNNAKYHPNPYVYKVMCKALGIDVSDREVNDKVSMSDKALKDTINKSRLGEEFSYLDEAIVDKKTFGRKVSSVSKYSKQIQNVFNELKNYGIEMAPDPINQRPNTVTFVGQDKNGTRIMIDFNTNHRDFEEDNGAQVFSNVFYGMRGTKAGSYNLDNATETAETLVNTLEEIGFKTEEQKAKEKQDAIKAKEDAKKAEEDKIKAAREKKKQDQEIIDYNKELTKSDEPEEEEEPEDEEDRFSTQEEFPEVLDNCLAELMKRGEMNASIHIKYSGKKEFSIDCFYVSANQYFVRSEDLELDELMKTKDMKTYLDNLAKEYKVQSCNTYTAPNEKGDDKGLSVNFFE